MRLTRRPVLAVALAAALISSPAVIGEASPAAADDQLSAETRSGSTGPSPELDRVLADLAKLGRAAEKAGRASRSAAKRADRAVRAADAAAGARGDALVRAQEAARVALQARARASTVAAQLARSGSTDRGATALILRGLSAERTLWGLSRMSELTVSSTQIFSEATTAQTAADTAAQVAADAASKAADRAADARTTATTATKRYGAVVALIARQRTRIRDLSARSERLSDDAARAAPAAASGGTGSLGWVSPLSGTFRDGFGPRPTSPVAGLSPFHRGQDIAAPCGTVILAAGSGTVAEASYLGSYGNWVLIDDRDGTQTGYAHGASLLVKPGQEVRAGQPIATVGSTGASTGCHLHFEIRVGGAAVDPIPFMAGRRAPLSGR